MNITIPNLTPKQIALCDIMWALNGVHEVDSFIGTLPGADQKTCRSLIELMKMAFIDETDSVDEAQALLKQFTLKG